MINAINETIENIQKEIECSVVYRDEVNFRINKLKDKIKAAEEMEAEKEEFLNFLKNEISKANTTHNQKASEDEILKIVFDERGLKPQSNGKHLEALRDLKPPYRNFTSGTPVDVVTQIVNDALGRDLTEDQLVSYVVSYYNNYVRKK